MRKQNEVQEEFLPKWYPSTQPKSKAAENILAFTLIVLLTIFTLGIVSGIQHTSDTIKGRN